MKHKVLEEIKEYIKARLQREYGFVGLADSDNFAMLNSGGEGENLVIKIEDKQD